MSTFRFTVGSASLSQKKSAWRCFLRLFSLSAISLLLMLSAAQAADKDEAYLKIFNLIEQADTFQKTGDASRALVKYHEAAEALKNFRRENPAWNPKLVNYRWNDLISKIAVAQDAAAGKSSQPATEKPADQADTTVKPAADSGTTQVKLLQAGAEPRKVLRLAPKVGDTQTMALTMKMGMEMKMAEMEMPAMKIPPMHMDMNVKIKEVSDAGDITYELSMGDAKMDDDPDASPEIAKAMEAAMAGLKDMSGTVKLSNRGIALDLDWKTPNGANAQVQQTIDQMKDSMSHLTAPLPEDAVGVGAKWESTGTVKSQGMSLKQTATYELLSLEGDRVTIKTAITQSAANQKISNPSMPGLKVDVSKMTSKGSGKTTLDLSRILPQEGTMDLKTEMAMGIAVGGEKQTMTMKMDIGLQMESK